MTTEECVSTTHAIYESDGPIATLTFNRPEARNAMTWDMYQALVDACDRVDGDAAIRVLILKGAGGKAFVSGTDISQFSDFREAEDGIRYEARIDQVLDRIERMTKATIAEIQGIAAGGGCAIALTCDLRVATPESSFGIPVARTLGNCLSGASYSRLMDLLGPAVVKDMLLTGRFIPGAEALGLGIVNRLEPAETIDAAVRDYAMRIAGNAPLTIQATKEMIRRLMAARRLRPGDDHDIVTKCYTSRDFKEGVEAFVAKRSPKWSGS
jgi:enoyl-CoA hydratase